MLLHLPADHGADAVRAAIAATIATLPAVLRRTLTWVAQGHETVMRWSDPSEWIWSSAPVHEALVSDQVFQQASELLALGSQRAPSASRGPHVREELIIESLDRWPAAILGTERLEATLEQMAAVDAAPHVNAPPSRRTRHPQALRRAAYQYRAL